MSRVFNRNNYVHTPANAVYNGMQKATIGMWVFPTSLNPAGNPVLISKDPNNSGAIYFYLDSSTPFTTASLQGGIATTGNSATAISNQTIPLNTWSYVTLVYDLTTDKKIHLFINGVETTYLQQVAGTGTLASDSADGFYIGDDTFSNDGLVGKIAEVAVWNTVLSGSQISAAAVSTTGVSSIASANLVGYWHLCGTASPEPDSSGNGDSGVLGFVSGSNPTQGPDSPGFNCAGGPVASTTTLTADHNPQQALTTVNLTATVTPSSPTPTGTMNFFDGATLIGSNVPLVNGVAHLATSFHFGSHNLSAVYSGDTNYLTSTGTLTESITSIPTTLNLSATPNPGFNNQLISITATLTANPSATNGNVVFMDGTITIGTVPLNITAQNAVLNTYALTNVGVHHLTAIYTSINGDWS